MLMGTSKRPGYLKPESMNAMGRFTLFNAWMCAQTIPGRQKIFIRKSMGRRPSWKAQCLVVRAAALSRVQIF
jgi:hypothetical protein